MGSDRSFTPPRQLLGRDINTHGNGQPVIVIQSLPRIVTYAMVDEAIMVSPQDRKFAFSAQFNWPVQDDGIGKIIDPQPRGEAPVKRMAINDVNRDIGMARHHDVLVANIAVKDPFILALIARGEQVDATTRVPKCSILGQLHLLIEAESSCQCFG